MSLASKAAAAAAAQQAPQQAAPGVSRFADVPTMPAWLLLPEHRGFVAAAAAATAAVAEGEGGGQTVRRMRPGAVMVDISIDQGGCFETSRETSHSDPVYEVDGVLHYCVGNIPGAVPRTSTWALTNVTLPYAMILADRGVDGAVAARPELAAGLNVRGGAIVHPAVAAALA